MQILKGSKERLPDQNPFAYSKGSIYRDDNLDRMSARAESCMRTIRANDGYRGATEGYNELRMAMVDAILSTYPPQFSDSLDLVEIEGQTIRWFPEALLLKSTDSYEFSKWKREMDYKVVEHSGLDTKFTHHDQEWKDRLGEELNKYRQLINPAGE